MSKLQVDQRFSFTKIQSGVVYYKENRGLGPYAVPAKYYQSLIEGRSFLGQKGFTGSEVFEVEETNNTQNGWHVIGKMQGEDTRVSFYQKLGSEGSRYIEVKVD